MYKGASQSLQRQHAVDKPHPSRGYIHSGPDPKDALPDPSRLSKAEAHQERERLKLELARTAHDLTVAKVTGDAKATAHLGQRHQAIQARLIPVNARIRELALNGDDQLFSDAVRAVVDAETWAKIVAKKAELAIAAATGTAETRSRLGAEASQSGGCETAASPTTHRGDTNAS